MNEIKEKLDRLDLRLDNIDITLSKQAKDIEHHIQRTDLLQEQVKPIFVSHQQIIGMMKLIGWAGSLITIAASVYQALHH